MTRRGFLAATTAIAGAAAVTRRPAHAALPKLKITRVRFYESPLSRAMINQSFHVVTVETDAGITGIGEGGTKELIEHCGALIIGEDASRIDQLWQIMYRGLFYPAGREKVDAIGALDMALWDIKAKALGVPVYELLGGLARDHVECYATGFPLGKTAKEKARACMEAGFRAFRTSVVDAAPGGFVAREVVRRTVQHCQEIRDGVGRDGDWAIDYHTRLDFPDAVHLSGQLAPLQPLFCEDLVRSENPGVYRALRPQVKVPIAVGEQFGPRWDFNELVEQHLMDYSRVTLPNCGGITEFMKIAAMCETHYVGLIPHFTGPIAEAALVHCLATFSGPALMEMAGGGMGPAPSYLPEYYDFKKGKMWPNKRPGLGVTFDAKALKMAGEVTQPAPKGSELHNKMFRRPDGSFTNW